MLKLPVPAKLPDCEGATNNTKQIHMETACLHTLLPSQQTTQIRKVLDTSAQAVICQAFQMN